jgi:hypothetical protein
MSGSCWFATFLLIHVLMFHFGRFRDRFKLIARIFAAAVLGHLGCVLVMQFLTGFLGAAFRGWGISFCAGLMAMLCLFVLYMPFYFTVATSLSVQSMILIARSPRGAMPVAEMTERFASRQVLAQRLETMVRNGYLLPEGEGFRATAKGKLVGRFFSGIKALWRLGAGG